MLDTVEAVRFIQAMKSGRNVPLAIEAERADGGMVDVVVKLASCECGRGGLIREAVASMLAADLNLPIAEPFIVNTGSDFMATLLSPPLRQRFDPSVPAFGCALIEGMQPYVATAPLTNAMTDCAGRTLAFDGAIMNQDRIVSKANCLTNGLSLLLIDHELSLNLHGRGGILAPDPWQPNALIPLTMGPTKHLFFEKVKSQGTSYPAMLAQLAKITNERIEEYANAIPPEWDEDDLLSEITNYIRDLVANAAKLSSEISSIIA